MCNERQLKDALEDMLDNWVEDLNPAWRSIALKEALGFDHIDPELTLESWEPIFPVRRGKSFLGAPAQAHILRAFDGIDPDDVSCVILGQDPFPCPSFATGRAFEAGNVACWRELEKIDFSPSMRCYLQSICTARSGSPRYSRSVDEWAFTIESIECGDIKVPSPAKIMDLWSGDGVLLLNSSLTISRFAKEGDPHQVRAHLPLWRPLIVNVLASLATRPENPIVVLTFGEVADELLKAAERKVNEESGSAAQFDQVSKPHPAAGDDFLAGDNAFLVANAILQERGKPPIRW